CRRAAQNHRRNGGHMLTRLSNPFPDRHFWRGFGSMWARGLVGQSVPEPEPTGPATWSTFEHWDGDEDASVSSWVGQTAGIKFVQATSGDQPTYDAADSNWNGKGAFTHGADDHFEVDTGDLALSAQSFWHDGTTSYSLAM